MLRSLLFCLGYLLALPSFAQSASSCHSWLATPPVEAGPLVPFGMDVFQTQWICYPHGKCLVVLDIKKFDDPVGTHGFDQYAERTMLGKSGGVVRRDLPAGGMNCHAYACYTSGVPGINDHMWLETQSHDAKNPYRAIPQYQQILDEYFVEATDVIESDVIVFYDLGGRIQHSGIWLNERLIRSVLGEGPVVDAPISYLHQIYGTSSTKFFRRRMPIISDDSPTRTALR